MVTYILSQVAVFIGMAIDLTGQAMKNKKYILVFLSISCVFYATSYILLGSVLAAVVNGLAILRGIAYLLMDKHKLAYKWYLIPMFLTNAIFAVFAVFFWNNLLDIILVVSVFILTLGLTFKNVNIVRPFLIANNLMWFVFNLIYHSYVGIACNVAGLIISITALIVYNRKGKKIENEVVSEETQMEENINQTSYVPNNEIKE